MDKLLEIKSAEYVGDHIIDVTFSNGVTLRCDLSHKLDCGVVTHLKDKNVFKNFVISNGDIEWPNGIDIATEYLYKIGTSLDGSTKPREPDYVKWTA